MKKLILASAVVPFLALGAAPALAQSNQAVQPITGYGTLGYSHSDRGVSDVGGVTGRVGLRFGRFLGAEAEGTFGVTDDDSTRLGVPSETKWKRSVAAYAVGYVPVTERLDLIGRVGLANSKVETTTDPASQLMRERRDSINYGVGAQYFLTEKDGLRADFTHEEFRNGPGQAQTYGVSYVRRF